MADAAAIGGRGGSRGVTFLELLAAVLILSIVAAGAVKTWSLSSKVPANLRVTELASKIAVHEIERKKAIGYINLPAGTTTTYYDKYGSDVDSSGTAYASAQTQGYIATTVVSVAINRDNTSNTEDLLEVVATVTNSTSTKTYETQRTLMAFGGF